MKSILYIGNKLNNRKSNLSSISTLGPLLENEGYRLFYASDKVNKIARLFDMIFCCFRFCKKVDFLIIDTYSTLNFYYALIISQFCRLLKVKYIPSLNGGNLPKRLNNNPFLSKLIFNYAYKNVSPSLYLLDAFKKAGYKNVDYIPNTIEINKYKFKERDFKNINLLWVRSFSKIYNPSLAIKILKQLLDEGLQVTLCMVGPDSDGTLQDVRQLAKELQVDVTFTGKLTKKEWIALSVNYNVFINTTNFDNMPVSVLEAMALGLPIISTNVGGMPFLINNNMDGMLVEPNDSEAFVIKIKQMINNQEQTKKMIYSARQKVEAYDWDSIKHKWFQVLE